MKQKILSITKKDLAIHYFNGSGGGGQNRNKNANCVRMRHPDSGAMSTGQDCKSRAQNLKNAFNRIIASPIFKKWLKIKIAEKSNDHDEMVKKVEKTVNDMMRPENIKVEYL